MSICITLHLIFIHYTLLVESSKGRGSRKMSKFRDLLFGKKSEELCSVECVVTISVSFTYCYLCYL